MCVCGVHRAVDMLINFINSKVDVKLIGVLAIND